MVKFGLEELNIKFGSLINYDDPRIFTDFDENKLKKLYLLDLKSVDIKTISNFKNLINLELCSSKRGNLCQCFNLFINCYIFDF